MGKKETQAVAGVNSLNSSRWNPRILQRNDGGQGDPGRQQDSRREVCGKYRSSSVRPDCFPPLLVRIFCFSLGRNRYCQVENCSSE